MVFYNLILHLIDVEMSSFLNGSLFPVYLQLMEIINFFLSNFGYLSLTL